MDSLPNGRFGPFSIDVKERVLRRDGQPVPLTPKAFDLLAALIEYPGRLISKQELLQKVWPNTFVEESNLAYNVFALRKALGDTADNAQYIETVPKRGYRFRALVRPVGPGNGGRILPAGTAETANEAFTGDPHLSTLLRVVNEEPAPQSRQGDSAPIEADNIIVPFPRKDLVRRYRATVDRKEPPEDLAPESATTESQARTFPLWRRWALIGLTVVLLPCVYFAVQWRRLATEQPRAVPLTSLTGAVRSPSLSPDGHYVVFTWTGPKQDNPDLYVQQIEAGSPIRLTTDPSNDYSPSWSPDGRMIAFLRRAQAGPSSEVRVIAPLGGPERKVADVQPQLAQYRPISVQWCPDSSCVLVTDSPGESQADAVFAMALETRQKRQLTHPQGLVRDSHAAISPDGRSLIFRRNTTPTSGAFYRVALNRQMTPEGEPVRLTSTLNAGKPAWMPDSREVLFAARGWLWRLDALHGGTPARLSFVGHDGQSPVVSRGPEGRQRLVYVRSFADTNVWRVDTSAAGAPAASPPVAAIASTRGDSIPNLSTDGRRVVFWSDRSGEAEIWLANPDGSDALPLTSMAIVPGFPRWAPDDKLIAFHGDPAGRPDVLIAPASGGKPRILTTNIDNGGFPSFSRDGRWIYFSSVQKGEARVWRMPVTGGEAVPVTPNRGTIAIESRDGHDLYYVEATERTSSLWRLPLSGGEPVKLLDGVILGNFDVIERGIYYIDRISGETSGRPDDETRLQFFDFAAGRSMTVCRNLGNVGWGLTASRDGRTIFYSRTDASIDELMFVDGFR